MAKVKGYYNLKTEVFLGPMVAVNQQTGVATTPRYVENVCFGEYDTYTKEFVPHTNPYTIPAGSVATFDEDEKTFMQGKHEVHVDGIVEDKGLDVKRKMSYNMAQKRPQPKQVAPKAPAPQPQPAKKLITASPSEMKKFSSGRLNLDLDNIF